MTDNPQPTTSEVDVVLGLCSQLVYDVHHFLS